MDARRFDAIAREVAGGMSRRRLLRGLTAGAAAAAGSALLRRGEAAAVPADDCCKASRLESRRYCRSQGKRLVSFECIDLDGSCGTFTTCG